jgi:hypothetical protein
MASGLGPIRIRDAAVFASGALIAAGILYVPPRRGAEGPLLEAWSLGGQDGLVLASAFQLPGPGDPADAAAQVPDGPSAEVRPARAMTPELIDQCLQVAREVDPDLFQRLEQLRRESTDQSFRSAIRSAPHLVGLARLKEKNPRLYDVKIQELQVNARVDRVLGELVRAHRTGSPVEELEDALHELVRLQVGYSIASWGMALREIRLHVKGLEEKLASDSENFQKTVDQKFQELLDQVQAEAAAATAG